MNRQRASYLVMLMVCASGASRGVFGQGDERDPAMQEFFERTAPLNNAGKIAKPLFVVQGGNDPRVPRSEAEQVVERVAKNGTPVWYLLAKDEGHGFRKKANVDFQFYATILFVQYHLLGSHEPGQ